MARQKEAIRSNKFLADYLRSEYAIAYQLDRLRQLVVRFGTVPHEACNDPSIFPSLAFATQVLEVLKRSTVKQAKAFVKRVRTAFRSSENMNGLRLELQAATHFARRGLALQGIDADQLLSIHEQDSGPGERPTRLRIGVSNFLNSAPSHIVGVVFGSRSGLFPTVDGSTDSGGAMNFFLKEESPLWHASFRGPLRAAD